MLPETSFVKSNQIAKPGSGWGGARSSRSIPWDRGSARRARVAFAWARAYSGGVLQLPSSKK